MNCYLDADYQLIVGQDTVTTNCLSHLQQISGELANPCHSLEGLYTLPPLSLIELRELQSLCSRGKTVTFDAYYETWLRITRRLDLICKWWRLSAIE
jgi:hypothetical protein